MARNRRARVKNLTDPAIESSLGQLRTNGTLLVPGASLRPESREPKLPGPGWYRFYWLRDRGGGESPRHRLLSAQPVEVSQLPRWRPDELAGAAEKLRAAMGTTLADLADLDAGRLTEHQRREARRLVRRWRTAVATGVRAAIALLAALAAVGYGVIAAHLYGLVELGLVPILGLPLLVGGVWSRRRDLHALRAVLDGRQLVLRLEAPVSVYTSDALCQVIAGDVEFTVGAEVAGAFEPGRGYTLYYLPRPRQLLYAEPAARDEPVDS